MAGPSHTATSVRQTTVSSFCRRIATGGGSHPRRPKRLVPSRNNNGSGSNSWTVMGTAGKVCDDSASNSRAYSSNQMVAQQQTRKVPPTDSLSRSNLSEALSANGTRELGTAPPSKDQIIRLGWVSFIFTHPAANYNHANTVASLPAPHPTLPPLPGSVTERRPRGRNRITHTHTHSHTRPTTATHTTHTHTHTHPTLARTMRPPWSW